MAKNETISTDINLKPHIRGVFCLQNGSIPTTDTLVKFHL